MIRVAKANLPCPRSEDLEFGSLLGTGAFARVVHARDLRNDAQYAVKVVDKRHTQVPAKRNAILAEKAMLSTLEHQHIVSLHYAFQDDWRLYFVLELVEGGDLCAAIFRMGSLPLDCSRFYAMEITTCLWYLRSRQVAHRDLKPENMLLTLDGHLKLADFGAAILVPDEGEGDAAGGRRQESQEQPTLAGTSFYLPPEAVRGVARIHDAFSWDLWSFGCVMYQMLVGKPPFYDSTSDELVFRKILTRDYTFPQNLICGDGGSAETFVDSLLAEDPSDRLGAGPDGIDSVKCHALFGGSITSFAEMLQHTPAPRIHELLRRRTEVSNDLDAHTARKHSDEYCFDFASSAECTPELGGNFLSKRSSQIRVVDTLQSTESERDEPQFMLSYHPTSAPYSSWHASSQPAVLDDNPSQNASSGPESPEQDVPPLDTAQPCSETPHAVTEPKPLKGLVAGALDPQRVADAPKISLHEWLRDLLKKQTLLVGEDIAICGSIVRRRWPCLPPKVLVLTDWPRLLILDATGLRVLQDINLAACTQRGSPMVTVRSPVDFLIKATTKTYWCRDMTLGSDMWESEIHAAMQKAHGRVGGVSSKP